MKTDQEQQFEVWFKEQPFYMQELCKHGERLFIKDGDDYKFAAVRTAFAAFSYWYDLLFRQAAKWAYESDEMPFQDKAASLQLYDCAVGLSYLAKEQELQ